MAFRDLGNCPEFGLTIDVTTKDHKSSRGVTKVVDFTIQTEVSATIDFVLDEWNAGNLAYFLEGVLDTDSDNNEVVAALLDSNRIGTLKIVGQNDVGPKLTWEGRVQFIPKGKVDIISTSDDLGTIPLTAKVLKLESDGSYGHLTVDGGAVAPSTSNYYLGTGIVSFEEE